MKHIRLELPARRYNLLLEYPISYESGYEKTFFSLLVTYLEYYLPSSGSFPQEIGKSTSTNNFDQNMSSPKSRTSLRILRKTLSPSKRDLTQKIQPGQTSRTETFLTILSESFLAINNNVCPFEDQIRALRLTVKHLHSGERRVTPRFNFWARKVFQFSIKCWT